MHIVEFFAVWFLLSVPVALATGRILAKVGK